MLFVFCYLWVFSAASDFFIHNAAKDIAELDVGDLDDMTVDVTPAFLQKSSQKVKNQMVFVIMSIEWTIQHKKLGTDKLSSDWTTLLSLGGLNLPIYSIDPGRLLIVVDHPNDLFPLKSFLFDQPHLDFIEVDQRPFFPHSRQAPLTPLDERLRLETKHRLRPSSAAATTKLKPVDTSNRRKKPPTDL
jgi:hypothetical protein